MESVDPFLLIDVPVKHFTIPSWKELIPDLSVGFSTKSGGQSKGYYQSMNLALHVGDINEDVIANRHNLASILGFSFDAWTSGNQVHGNNIEVITEKKRGKGRFDLNDAVGNTDGIVTNVKDILLTSFYADCVPLFFLDPIKKVIGLAHAGWKGAVLKIGEKMVGTMVKEFNSNPSDIKTAIGPSIGQCCYEVNDKVINALQTEISVIPDESIIDKKNGHFDLDLKIINRQILINAGIVPENIEMSLLCTSCENDLFFSYRRDQGNTGRMVSWIGLKEG